MFQIFENGIRGGISGVFGDRYIESDNNRKIFYIDQNNLYGYDMSQHLRTGFFQIYENISITECFVDKFLNTHVCTNIGYVLTVDLIYLDYIKNKNKIFPFCPENKIINPDKFTEHAKEHVPKPYKPTSKMVCDQTIKKII